jgi:hypothetical protein
MKISKILKLESHKSFFWSDGREFGLCIPFIRTLLNVNHIMDCSVEVVFSNFNPKKKGFREVKRTDYGEVKLKDTKFELCYSERTFLIDSGIEIGDNFWMKAEIIS